MKINCTACNGQIDIDGNDHAQQTEVICPKCNQEVRLEKSLNPGNESFASAEGAGGASVQNCYLCEKAFSRDKMVRFQERWVCAHCKPRYLQMLMQGLHKPGEWRYGGFWIRAAAYLLDGLALGAFNLVMGFLVGAFVAIHLKAAHPVLSVITTLLGVLVGIAYFTFFVGKYRATPGKMACGLKILTSDGGKVSYPRALGRYFAQIVSSIVLCIGYLMAGFDREKRALHDRLCDTRVVYK